MERIIASTMTHASYSLKDALQKLKEAGFTKVELCSAGELCPHFDVKNATLETLAEVVNVIRESGMGVHCINVGEDDVPLEKMEIAFALAKMIGAEVVTYLCGWRREGVSHIDRVKEQAEYNSKLADLGDKYGVTCAIEAPHKLSIASNTEEVDIYWSMQDPRVKLTFDTAHLTFCGEDMITLAEKYVDRIAHSHVRDAEKGNSLLRYGEGVIDFGKYFKVLEEGGYKGYFSMEYPTKSPEEAAEKLKESVEFLSKFNI